MRYLSLFSGIEAATVAWEPIGFEPVAFAEIDKFASSLLADKYPDVPNLGDVTKITESQIKELGKIDLVVGGSPCQAFSVAGLRRGLNDPRGNLTLEFIRIVDLASPDYVLWENVPGVLSDKTDAFVCLLEGLSDLGYCIDAQLLDAQEFGLAQRRERVFVVCRKSGLNQMSIASGAITRKKAPLISGEKLDDQDDQFKSKPLNWGFPKELSGGLPQSFRHIEPVPL